jgi:hypothetical protein
MLRNRSDPAETILAVDSNPMGMKLAAALLRAEVYAAPEKMPTRKPADGEA